MLDNKVNLVHQDALEPLVTRETVVPQGPRGRLEPQDQRALKETWEVLAPWVS